jgi:hypothetical protein
MEYGITVITRDFGPLNPSPTLGAPTNMSKGKKFNTPKKFWRKMLKKTKRPWYARQSWRKTTAHVLGRNHSKFKWYFRQKKWYNDNSMKRMSMRFPMSHEIWCWD